MDYGNLEEQLIEVAVDINSTKEKDLVVFNDDFNTFDHVINTLIKICSHSPEQAEQCTFIIHYKGKCSVKKGSYQVLKPLKEGITDAGIGASIF
ncbi:MAG: ATP-dependent Clp protease adaptor ClpS [Bacteroidetes bacterium]|nr:ATP-dependent Clp protease adaptor ClpS [Bacteroidota bacterium]